MQPFLPQTPQDLIEQQLAKAGVHKTACYDPAVLAQMRCYALFSIVDRAAAVYSPQKITGLSGIKETPTSKSHVGAAPSEPTTTTPVHPRVAPYNPTGKIDNCVACTTAFIKNGFGNRMIDTADTIERKFGITTSERHLSVNEAKQYIQRVTNSTASANSVVLFGPNAPKGFYALFLWNKTDQWFHVVTARITDARKTHHL